MAKKTKIILKKESIKILHQGDAKLVVSVFLWEKGGTNGFRIVEIFLIFP
ncbi:MAG: hypothetical protein NC314_07855 [Roseburia sp.]|nr:hypothetical protein [Roseburia sp.]